MNRLPGAAPQRSFQHLLVVLVTFVALTAILSFNVGQEASLPSNLSVGEVSPQDIEAPRTLEILNDDATRERREEAARSARTVYILDKSVPLNADHQVEQTFSVLLQLHGLNLPEEEARKKALLKQIPLPLGTTTLEALLAVDPPSLDKVKVIVRAAVDKVMSEKIPEFRLDEARKHVADYLAGKVSPPALGAAVTDVAQQAVQPNFVADWEATERARQEKRAQVEPVKTLIIKGQMIVRKGDIITPEQMTVLKAYGMHEHALNLFGVLGSALFVCLAIFIVGVYLAQQESPLLSEPRLLWLLVLLVIAGLAIARGGTQISPYYAPIAMTSLLVAILLDYRLSLLVTSIMALCVGIMTSQFAPCAVVMLTGLVAVLSVTHVTRRGDLIVASLVVCLVNVLAVLVFSLWNGEDIATLTSNTFIYGALTGATASVVAVGFLPFLEAMFNVTTHIKLLELSNPSEPVLQRLMVEAPGTYHHSMIVANLAESAARSIEADGLLAKVGAFYHDIGKMKAANFFVENQLGQENPHDRLTPSMSAQIIISHVTDGMEMARQARIPQIIADFIDMHHGDRLVGYFYQKALQRGEQTTEGDFRYHGRRPRTRETAIVMMADTIEAKARLLPKPDQDNLDKMVRQSIKIIMDDGQLDDSDLSLRDIQTISKAFVKTLMGIYHSRIEYPNMPVIKEEAEDKPTGPAPPRSVEITS